MPKKNRTFSLLLTFIFTFVSVFANVIPVVAKAEQEVNVSTSTITSRSEFGAVEVYDNVYIIGGINSSGYLNTAEKYDVYNNKLSSETSMNIKRSSFGTAAYKNKIYVIGGKTSSGITAKAEVYDIDNKTWSEAPSMPVPKHSFKAALLNGKIYIVGGVTSQGVSNTVEVFDVEKNTWDTAKSMPTARCNLGVTAYDGKIYAIGGKTADDKVSNIVEVYDEISNTWKQKSNMITAREGLSTAVLDNNIYALGGGINTVEVYNPMADNWYLTRNFSQALTNAELVNVDKKLTVIDGKNGDTFSNKIEEYRPRLIEDILSSVKKFSEASEEDRNIICNYYNAEASVIQEYENKEYSLTAILNSFANLSFYKLKPDAFKVLINDKEVLKGDSELIKSLNEIILFNKANGVPEEKALEAKQLVLDKVDVKKVEGAYDAYKIIAFKNTSLSTLTLKEIININEKNVCATDEIKEASNQKLSNEAISMVLSYEKYSGVSGNKAVENVKSDINNYFSKNQKNVLQRASGESEYSAQQSGTNIEEIKKSINSAYNVSKYNKEDVDACTGAVRNDYSVLGLEGKNGLNLNISASYSSLDAGLKTPDYNVEPSYLVDGFKVILGGRTYEKVFGPDGSSKNYDVKPLTPKVWFFTDKSTAECFFSDYLKKNKMYVETPGCAQNRFNVTEYVLVLMPGTQSEPSKTTTLSKDNYIYNYNKLGLGWQFNFSSIETNDKGKSLHLRDGRSYKINGSSLEGYDFKDMTFSEQNSYTDEDTKVTSKYVLEHKDKTKEYFTAEGRLLAVVDRYGNKIRYQYTVDSSKNVSQIKIIDTRNRVVEINYKDNSVELKKPSGDLVNFILENKSETFEGTTYSYKVLKDIQEVSKDGSQSRVTSYGYNTQTGLENTGKFSYESSSGGLGNVYARLNSINYSTGASTVYTFEKAKGYLGNVGYFDYYRVKEVMKNSKASDSAPYKAQYAYEGDYTKESAHKTTKTVVGDNGKGTKTIINYNTNHLVNVEEVYSAANNTKLVETSHEYDCRKMPKKQTTIAYYYDSNNAKIGSIKSETEMEYDFYRDKLWDKDVNEIKTFYTYDSKYHQIMDIRKNVEGKELRTQNEINQDNGSVTKTTAYNNENGTDKSIITSFKYYPDGTVKEVTNDNNNNPKYKSSTIEYSNDDNYFLEGYSNKAYSVTSTTKFKDCDQSDQKEKTFSETSVYDYNTGNLICKIDGKLNKTTFQYDYKTGKLIWKIEGKLNKTTFQYDCATRF